MRKRCDDSMKKFLITEHFTENETIKINEDIHGVETEHIHEFVELVYVLDGNMIHGIDGEFVRLYRGGLLYIDVGQKHSYCSAEKVKFVNISVKPEFFDSEVFEFLGDLKNCLGGWDKKCVQFNEDERSYVDSIMQAILWEYSREKEGAQKNIKEYIKILLAVILRKMKEQQMNPLAVDLKTYIDMRCFDNIGLSDIAEVFGYNPKYLSRKFKKEYNDTIVSYIQKSRVSAARNMLENTDFSIERIATCVGFGDSKKIYKMFKKYLGETPNSIRKKAGK